MTIPEPPPLTASAEDVARGRILFGDLCGYCHMPSVFGRRGNVPDLRYMSAETHAQWPAIVLGGDDPSGVAKTLSDFLKETKKVSVKAGAIGDSVLTSAEVKQLSKLPSLEVLQSQLLSLFNTTKKWYK